MAIQLDSCKCGGEAEFIKDKDGNALVACKECKISTPPKAPSLDYAANQQVANIWNAGSADWPRWIKPVNNTGAYPLGAHVSYKNRYWESLFELNMDEPAAPGWKDLGIMK